MTVVSHITEWLKILALIYAHRKNCTTRSKNKCVASDENANIPISLTDTLCVMKCLNLWSLFLASQKVPVQP